ncbi:hypothetical protein ACFPK9_14095 [Rubritalea spongiae]|uniref:Uncharacterized protein n=1 Tax=Rubritalea spongiae TaxID=430797 RepID=A0ABW5E1V7_9BACT
MEFEARILWHSAKWLPFIKWPSSDEIDFGDFIVKFYFARGLAEKMDGSGVAEALATFSPVSGQLGVLGIQGRVETEDFLLDLQKSQDGSEVEGCEIIEKLEPERSEVLKESQEDGLPIFLFKDKLVIRPAKEAGRVVLRGECDAAYSELAITLACFLVFNRYVQDVPPAGGEFD